MSHFDQDEFWHGPMPQDELVEVLRVDILHETEEAILIDREDMDDPTWIPLSQVEAIHRSPKPFESRLVVTRWIAAQKGLI